MPANANSISGRFAETVLRHVGRLAISAPAGQWSYGELDRRSNLVATEIRERIGDNSEPVALLMEHDAPLIASILGVLRANKIYLALDPGHPTEQLAAMLASSGAKLLLTDTANLTLANSFASGQLQVLPVTGNLPADFQSATFPEISPDAGAWLMFTSGSTSAPKGVWQNHRGIVQEAEVYAELIGLTPEDRVSLLASCSLAASGSTLFATLLTGATLCPFHLRSQGIERLAGWLPREHISIFHSVPTIFRHLATAADGKNSFGSVRLIRLGGEPVLSGDLEVFQRLCPDNCCFMQSLSSTETGIISTFTMDKQTRLESPVVPAGRAVRGVEIFLVDDQQQPVKDGGEGRIAVRSARLRQGYWRQPDETAEKFKADVQDARLRIFISNDWGRFLPGGLLEHLGRVDQMVKIRGQRVDLSAVEAVLLATGLAKEVVVVAREDGSGEKRLAAYLVPPAGAAVSSQDCRHELARQLPAHMVPNHFVMLEKLPQTMAGKVDRRALTPPSPSDNKTALARKQKPSGVAERRLARIWKSVLKLSQVNRLDDFFELGGTSLQSIEVLLEIEDQFGILLPPSILVEYGTIEKLAAILLNRMVIPSPGPLVKLRDGSGGRPLFLIHSGQGDVALYGQLTRRLPERPVYGLQSVGIQGECWPLMNVPAMARRYLAEIKTVDPTGPYFLVGACMGGLVALEVAQMLVREHKQVGLLAMLDTFHPIERWRQPGWKEKLYCPVRDNVRDAFRILRWSILRAGGLGRSGRSLPGYRRFVADMNSFATRFYQFKPYPGTITLILSTKKTSSGEDRRLLMGRYAKDSVIVNIPVNNAGLYIRPAVNVLAERLQRAIAQVDVQPLSRAA